MDKDILIDKFKGNLKHIGIQHPIIGTIKHIRNNTSDDSDKFYLAEGIWAHQKLLKAGLSIQCFLICPELIFNKETFILAESCISRAGQTFAISGKLMNKICDRDDPDGFVSVVHIPDYDLCKLHLKTDAFVLVLDGLETPGNIGTILRTCDGAGVDAVFICNRKARLTNPKTIKGSMGAVFTMPIIEFDDTGDCVKWLNENYFSIYLADTRANKTYKYYDYNGNTVLVMGSERYGISKEWYSCNPKLLSIPMLGTCDSLNVGVAASVIAYEICMKKNMAT